MGFYGNITNTARTQFSFDKIYSNKYEMVNSATTDGIYVGRYVLVEYDLDMGADAYPSTLYKYGDKVYSSIDSNIITNENNQEFIFFEEPLSQYLVKQGDIIGGQTIKDNTIIRLQKNHNISNLNSDHIFIEITSIDVLNNIFKYMRIDENRYLESFLSSNIYNYYKISLTKSTYEKNVYYLFNEENNKYELSAEDFDANKQYYFIGKYDYDIYINSDGSGYNKLFYPTANENALSVGDKILIKKNHLYSLNPEEELWYAHIEADNTITWKQILQNNDISNYYRNFNIDKIAFPNAKRGYDSTVWQKVYSTGEQYYIMIAELNTIIPNFGIDAEAPTTTLIKPYYDTDTTNMYYKIKIQPQWGFRTKAANSTLFVDTINNNGMPSGEGFTPLRQDGIEYPSDVYTSWKSNFYDKNTDEEVEKYYNPRTGLWEDKQEKISYQMRSAIYFNKAGFDAQKINYSKDLIDEESLNYNSTIADSGWVNNNVIEVTPTGYSGHLYSKHNGSKEKTAQVDTQELSIMIPALGDSIAKMWDIVYGGRQTNDSIKETDNRNLDIFWEDANGYVNRNGLRLINDNIAEDGFTLTYNNIKTNEKDGSIINLGDINTLAGCINSVHDLMGMILVNTSEEELQQQQLLFSGEQNFTDYKNIDGDKIYYFSNDGTYRRKHKTYEYTEVQYIYEPIELTEDTYIKNFYYYSENNGESFIPCYNDDFDEEKEYYVKKIDINSSENQTFSLVQDLKNFNSNSKHFPYQRTLKFEYLYDKSLYPKDNDTVYYYATNNKNNIMDLSDDYEPNKFFFYDLNDIDENNNVLLWQLAQEKTVLNKQYFSIEPIKYNVNLTEDQRTDDIGKYFYCPGFFYYKKYDLLTEAPNADNINSYYKEISPVIDTNEEEIYNINGKIYVPLSSDGENPDYTYNTENEIIWNSALYENNIVKNIYIATDGLILDENPKMTKDREYYVVFAEEADVNQTWVNENGSYMPVISTTTYNINKYRVIMEPYFRNRYYKIKDSYTMYSNVITKEIISEEEFLLLNQEDSLNYTAIALPKTYELMTEVSAQAALEEDYTNQFKAKKKIYVDYYVLEVNPTEVFYGPNRYFYNTYEDKLLTESEKDAWEDAGSEEDSFAYGDWIIDKNLKRTPGRRYYLTVDSHAETGPYYRPNYYYYYDNTLEKYVLDLNNTMRENTQYYLKNDFYILEDKTGRFKQGAIWNYYDSGIPCILKIATRKDVYEMQELIGFARTFNTIHGLILKINDLLELNDPLTRDTKTLQGCINVLNDIIYKFDELEFNKILVTDQSGRIITKDPAEIKIAYTSNDITKQLSLEEILIKLDNLENRISILENRL